MSIITVRSTNTLGVVKHISRDFIAKWQVIIDRNFDQL